MMDILKQCEVWNDEGAYGKIIDLLEHLPEESYTTEVKMELARAYLNHAGDNADNKTEKKSLETALSILLSIADEMYEDARWNYRIGLTYYRLNNELKALPYLKVAAQNFSDDEQLPEWIEYCESKVSLSTFDCNFKERTVLAWKAFIEKEAAIRAFMENDEKREHGQELVGMVHEIFDLALDGLSFEIGFNGEKYEIIFSPEGIKRDLFPIDYFVRRAPEEVLGNWNFLVGRRKNQDTGIRMGGYDISGDDVQVLVEKNEDRNVSLTLHCPKLKPLFEENEDAVWQILSILTDQMLGELSAMAYIADFNVSGSPLGDEAITLNRLPDRLSELGLEQVNDPKKILESYTGYKIKPNEDPEADWREDVVAGSTNFPALISSYMNGDNEDMERFYANGIAAGFLVYSLDTLEDEDSSDRIFDFRDELTEYLENTCGEDNIYITGGATGLYYGYVDFIAWDLQTVLDAANSFFNNSEITFAAYHSFVREADLLTFVESDLSD